MSDGNTLAQAIKDRNHAEHILAQINRICHVPSNGRAAYSHFMRDFDEIRKLTEPFVSFAISLPKGEIT